MNSFYTPVPDLMPGTKARSVDINNLNKAVDVAFDKLPNPDLLKRGTVGYAVDTGTVADAYKVDLGAAITAYTDGLLVRMKPTRENTAAATLNVNGLGAVAIKRQDGTDVQAGDILTNGTLLLSYVGGANCFVLASSVTSQVKQAAASATAAAASAGAAAGSATTAGTSAGTAVDAANYAAGRATVAGDAATAAISYRDAALGYRNEAQGFKDSALSYRDAALGYRDTADTRATAADASATLAANWATSLVNTFTGAGGKYGALKYANDAAASATLANNWATSTATFTGSGGLYGARKYANDAAASATSAKDWATKTASEVVAGQGFGAQKYANDAAGSATAAAGSASAANTSAQNAATSAASVVRNGSSGVAGLTGFLLDLFNAAGTIKSALASLATAARTWSFPDKSGTVALTSDITDASIATINSGPLAGFRNYLINGCMRISQRGSSWTIAPNAGFYTLDRWYVWNGTNATIVVQTATVGNYEGSDLTPRLRVAAQTAPTTGSVYITQYIEGAQTLAGKSAVASATVLSEESTMFCRYSAGQNFGTNGSATVDYVTAGFNPSSAAPRTAIGRFNFGSIVGKTVGANNCLYLTLEMQIRTALGHTITDVQLEQGSVVTPFERRPIALEMAACQRYFAVTRQSVAFCGNAVSGFGYYACYSLPVTMRRMPDLYGTTMVASGFPAAVGTLGSQPDNKSIYEYRVANTTGNAAVFGSEITAFAEF